MGAKTFLLGVAAGAGLMYLLDPDKGSDRRARLKDQIEQRMNSTSEFVEEARGAQQGNGARNWSQAARGERARDESANAAEVRDRSAEQEMTAFTENPGSIPSD
jgi:hypothetical protein